MHKSSNFLWSCFHAKIREIELLCNFLFLVFHRKFVKLIFATSLKLFSRKNREIAFCRLSWIWFHEKIRESKWFQLFLKFFSRKNREVTFCNFPWIWFHEEVKVITLSTNIYDLVLLNVCHFHHQDDHFVIYVILHDFFFFFLKLFSQKKSWSCVLFLQLSLILISQKNLSKYSVFWSRTIHRKICHVDSRNVMDWLKSILLKIRDFKEFYKLGV